MKKWVAIGFLAAVLLLSAAALALVRTEWAGRRLCAAVASRVQSAAGLPLELAACRVDPLALGLEIRGIRLGPAAEPVFAADRVRASLALVQLLGGRTVELADLEVERPRVRAAVPPPGPARPAARCPPEALSRFHVHRLRVTEGSIDLALPAGRRLRVERLDVRAAPPSVARGLRALASAAGRTGLVAEASGVEWAEAGRVRRAEAVRADVDLALDLSRLEVAEAALRAGGARLEARGSVADLCDPRLDLRVSVAAPLRALLELAGSAEAAEGSVTAELRIAGRPAAPAVEGEVKLRQARLADFRPGDAAVRFRFAGSEVQVQRAEVPLAGGDLVARGTVHIGEQVALEGEAHLEGPELGDVLGRFGLPGAWVSMRVRGDVKASGTAWPLALRGTAALDLSDFRVVPHAWSERRGGEKPILEFRRGRLETAVRADPDGVHLEGARVRVGREELTAAADLHLEGARGFAIEFSGGVDLGELAHLASVPVAGRASLSGRLRAVPYGNPQVEAVARVKDFHFLDLDLGEAGAEIGYGEGGGFSLAARAVEGRRGETRYGGSIAVDLGRSPPALDGRFEARGRLRDLFEGAMPWLPQARAARDALDAAVQAEARLSGPAPALDVEIGARLGPGGLLGRPFDSGQLAGRIEGGRRFAVDRAELRLGAGAARVGGWVQLEAPFAWELEAFAAGLALDEMRLPGGRFEGSLSGQAQVSGSAERPAVRFAANGVGVGLLGVPVGTVQLGGTLRDRALAVTGSAEGIRFVGQARTDGDMPFEARAEIDVDDVTRFAPGGPPAGLRARARGEVRAAGVLADPERLRAEVTLSELQGGYGDFKVQNRDPVALAVDGGRVELRSLTLVGTNTEFALSGARERDGRLSLGAEGSLDLRLLGGLVPGVVRSHGRLALEAHVSGTAVEPLLVGSGRLRDAGFALSDVPLTFAAMNGELAFSQNRVIFDHLPAAVNGGRAELEGEVELSRFVPSRIRASARIDEVPLRIPASLPSVVSGQLAVAGTPGSLLLSGKLDVLRAQYTERVDLEKSFLEFRRRAAAPPAVDRSGERLRFDVQVALSGDIHVENDLVRGDVRGELALTGSLAAFGLVGTLAMAPGARATFRGNEFLLTHAVVELVERRRIRAQLDVHGETQVRDYQVFMHLFGAPDDPQLSLTSVPALAQEDIIALLSIGITSRDTAASGGYGGAAQAAAYQALFSASGLDEQVKRFLPRAGVLKDVNVRITSAYSEGAGQVVPRAEFESKLDATRLARDLKDLDLRLRFQAPLSGVQKGTRAQAEFRLKDTPEVKKLGSPSVQFQWDNDNPDVAGGDIGADLRLRWEWSD